MLIVLKSRRSNAERGQIFLKTRNYLIAGSQQRGIVFFADIESVEQKF